MSRKRQASGAFETETIMVVFSFSKDGNRPRRVRGHFRLLTKWVELASGGAGIVRSDGLDWVMENHTINSGLSEN